MKVAYVANRFPRWGGGWVLNEVRGLTMAGIDLALFSFKPPFPDVAAQPGMSAWIGKTTYVPSGLSWTCIAAAAACLLRSPAGFIRGVRAARRLGGRMARGGHLFEVFFLASRIRSARARHIHGQHGDYLADAAMAAAACLELPFSFSGHANDLYTNPGRLMEKAGAATFIATCTGFNETYLRQMGVAKDKVARVYHGVDLARFSPPDAPGPADKLITITRLKEKKGFPYLLEALALLKRKGVAFTLDIYGDGDQRERIALQIDQLGLGDRVSLKGVIQHEKIPEVLAASGGFVLACVVLPNQDRDGIPNTIIEALACGVPVVSTSISGIPEAVREGESGLLVAERDSAALARAIERILVDDALRTRCRAQGRRIAEENFSIEATGKSLSDLFRKSVEGRPPAGPGR